jgi:5-methyltetrahydrofolate--homocysteine methyltransferase
LEFATALNVRTQEIPVIIQANAGMPHLINGKTVFHETPEMMASYIPELIKSGVNIIGGCCGTTPVHIREIGRIIGR